jgi:hypothetical protein
MGSTSSGSPLPPSSADEALATPDPTVAATAEEPASAAVPEPAAAPVLSAARVEAGPQALRGRVQRRFRVRYLVDRVIVAEDIRDAIRQMDAIGAADITAIVRED